MITIYHNPRCSKSRCGLDILKNSEKQFEVVEYLKNPLTKKEIITLLEKLGIPPMELVRKNEGIWKENYQNKAFTDNEIIDLLVTHPQLIERPIVVQGNKAIIGRPEEKIYDFIR